MGDVGDLGLTLQHFHFFSVQDSVEGIHFQFGLSVVVFVQVVLLPLVKPASFMLFSCVL
jgi:hypothetical protein